MNTPPLTPRRKSAARAFPKGRLADEKALAEVRALLGDRSRQSDLLIEHLHLINDAFGGLSKAHLAALACDMGLPLAHVHETATFYYNFIVSETPPPRVIRVCDSLPCALAGARALSDALERGKAAPLIQHAACMGRCDHGPVVRLTQRGQPDRYVTNATAERVTTALSQAAPPTAPTPGIDLATYRAGGGYGVLEACLAGEYSPNEIIVKLDDGGLRGLGGAGFPSGRKWRMVRGEPGPRLLAVNGDESEPGTFKDRHYLLADPHRFLEGMLIAAWAIEAEEIYLYLRDEYADIRALLDNELAALKATALLTRPVHLRRGAGAYICGEESAMLESLEGKRGLPRHKPPFPSQVGLFGCPTLINNIETLYWTPEVIARGADWFAGQGRRGHQGLRSFSVSGRVREPGVKLAPAGITARELIDEFCGGMADGHTLKAYLPGGASGGLLPARLADIALDFGTLEEHGCFIGSAAIIVLSQQDAIRNVVRNIMAFFEHESCGQCTPCRLGTQKASQLMEDARWDSSLLGELSACMADASICGLGQAAPNVLRAARRYFPDEMT